MARFDFSNWSNHKAEYLIILVIVVMILVFVNRQKSKEKRGGGIKGRIVADGNGEAYYRGRGSKHDSVAELLDRIDWASYLDKRITLWYRIIVITFIVMLFIMAFVIKRLLRPTEMVVLFFVVFVPFYASHQMDYVHGDIYNDYYIKRNVELIREKLGVEKGKVKAPKVDPPSRPAVMNPK